MKRKKIEKAFLMLVSNVLVIPFIAIRVVFQYKVANQLTIHQN